MALNPLTAIKKYESGGKNVPNYMFGPGYTAQGYFQITNSTWRDIAPKVGIDLKQYPNAMSAPYSVQESAAAALYNTRGFQPWAPHNPALRTYIAENGGAGAFVRPGQLSAGAAPDPNLSNATEGAGSYTTSNGSIVPEAAPPEGFTPQVTAEGDKPLFLRINPKTPGGQGGGFGGSRTVPQAIDRQRDSDRKTALETTASENKQSAENTKSITDKAQGIYDAVSGSWSDYFVRLIFIFVGLMFLWGALRSFGVPGVPAVPKVALA